MQVYSTSQTNDKTAATQQASQDQQSSQSFEFSDQRPEMVAQRKLRQLAQGFSEQATQLKQTEPSSGEPVMQLMTLVNRKKAKKGTAGMPKITTSDNFETNHIFDTATAITDQEAEDRRAARGANHSQNTILKQSALKREAGLKRALLTANVDGTPVTLNFKAGEAKVATRTGAHDVSSAIVHSSNVDADNPVQLNHLANIPGA